MITCAALALGLNLGTYHFDRDRRYEEINPGVYAICDRAIGGVYRNSEGKVSTHIGYFGHRVLGPLDLQVGVVTGYRRAAVAPMAALSYRYRNARFTFVPPFRDVSGGIHFSLEF